VVHDEKMIRNYSNPLVTDALIDLRVTASPEAQAEALIKIAQVLADEFPRFEPIVSQTVKFAAGASAEATSVVTGCILQSENPSWVAQLTLESFSFVHHAPYTDWATYSAMARRVWELYKEAICVTAINRVAVRYINRLDIPSTEQFSDYLELKPLIPETYPSRAILGFTLQLQMPQLDLESQMILNLARLVDPSPDVISCVLDFDLFREHQWGVDDDDAIWKLLGHLRERKNLFFEASITSKTRVLMGLDG
jgi:uncharacterized protein (TIGR04255 family)